MGLWKSVQKGVRGAVNTLPGGRYLTGDAANRQKRLYREAEAGYENYKNQAQSQIESMSRALEQSKQNLLHLEQQKYYHHTSGQQLGSHVGQYESTLSNLERQKSAMAAEGVGLEKAAAAFKAKAPDLADKIGEVEKLPAIFEKLYETTLQQKERLKGLTEEEAAVHIKKHKSDVELLKKQREETEEKIKRAMAEITTEHGNLTAEKSTLEQSLERYKYGQDRLLQENSIFEQQRSQLQRMLQDYMNEQSRIEGEYGNLQSKVSSEEVALKDYITSAEKQLGSLGDHAEWRAGKYKREAKTTGIAQGIGLTLGGLALGGGLSRFAGDFITKAGLSGAYTSTPMLGTILSGLGSGISTLAPLLGIGTYLNNTNRAAKAGIERGNLSEYAGGTTNLGQIARYGLSAPKVTIPELGGLKQSLSHFNLPMLPSLKELPSLAESLGKIISLKDIEGLSLGLPSITSASGKKYNTEVLYNPDFIKKLKKVSRGLAVPYLKQGTQGAVYG